MSVYSSMPTPPPAVQNFLMTNTQTDPCKLTMPPNVDSVYSSYLNAVSSWYNKNSDAWSSALSQCPAGYVTNTEVVEGHACTQGSGNSGNGGAKTTSAEQTKETGSSSGSGSGSSSGSGSGSGSGSSGSGSGSGSSNNNNNNNNNNNPGKNAGHRETGFIGAAVALAGFLGFAIAL
ncbi:hypothetical protein VTI74DRAFT_471 [Chaetomium olivicolor]